MGRCLLCVVTGRYLPMAMAMVEAYRRHHPDDAVRVLLADVSTAAASRVRVEGWDGRLRIDGIDAISSVRTDWMRRYYDDHEMVGASRSAFIRYVFERDQPDSIVMLDADIDCYAPLTPFFDALQDAAIALTPHVTSPPPRDGALPDDLELVRNGFVNNGCCAVKRSAAANQALDWLISRVERTCFFYPELNLYNEQSWVSFLPWYFPDAVHLVRDPGMNVAYWNLYERQVRRLDGGHTVNGAPLRFLHFSGHVRGASALTQHSARQGGQETMSVLAPLTRDYDHRLVEAFERYPQLAADLPCSAESLPRRLRTCVQLWGEAPPFYQEFEALKLHRARGQVRSAVGRLARRVRLR